MTQFPDELQHRYESIETLPTDGGQARIYRCRPKGSDTSQVVKVYRGTSEHVEVSGLGPVLTAWLAADSPSNLVTLIEFGETERIDFQGDSTYEWFEVQEYMSQGTLRKYVDQLRESGSLSDQTTREGFATHLAEEFLRVMRFVKSGMNTPIQGGHQRPIIHCDLKPQNVFVRNISESEPLQPSIVLGDFGSAREAIMSSQRTSGATHTPQYAAPETLLDSSRISEARDYWALGVILFEVACGERPYHHALDLLGAIRSAPPKFDAIQDERLGRLLRGLLHRKEPNRWGLNELERWMTGELVDVLPDIGNESHGHRVSTGFSFLGETAFSVSELVRLMNLEWRVAYADYLSPVGIRALELQQWLREEAHEIVATDILNSPSPGQPGDDVWCDRVLARLGTNYRPDTPVFRPDDPNDGFLTESGLLEKARIGAGTKLEGAAARRWLDALRDSRTLDIWAGGAQSGPWMSRVAHEWDRAVKLLERRNLAQPDTHSIVLMALLDPSYRASLHERAQESAQDDLALQQRWFRELADADSATSGGVGRDISLILGRADAREQTTYEERPGRRRTRIFSGVRTHSAPVIDYLELSPGRAPLHTPLEVRWRVSNAQHVHIEGLGTVASSGSRTFHPRTSGRIRLVATSRDEIERNRTVDYIVETQPSVDAFKVEPLVQVIGAAVTISWSVPNAQRVEVVGVGTGGPSGELRHFPQNDREYVLIATNSAGRATSTSEPVRIFSHAPFESQLVELPVTFTQVDLPSNFELNAAELLIPSSSEVRPLLESNLTRMAQLPSLTRVLDPSQLTSLPRTPKVSLPDSNMHDQMARLPLLPRIRLETSAIKSRRVRVPARSRRRAQDRRRVKR